MGRLEIGLEKLLKKISLGEEEAFNEFYIKTNTFVFNEAFAFLCNYNDAGDVVQNVYIRIFKLKADLIPKYNVISWIRKVVRNECINYIRKNTVETVELTDNIHEKNFVNEIDDKITFEQRLKILEDEEREIVVLKVVVGLKHSEIANIMGIPQGTVRWKYRQAISKIKERYFDE